MNSMQAFRFFLELVGGIAIGASGCTWAMLYFLRKKVRQKRSDRAARHEDVLPDVHAISR